jgi:hypothetical protein
MTIAGQRLGEHIPEVTLSAVEGHLLPGNGSLHTFPQHAIKVELIQVVISIRFYPKL